MRGTGVNKAQYDVIIIAAGIRCADLELAS